MRTITGHAKATQRVKLEKLTIVPRSIPDQNRNVHAFFQLQRLIGNQATQRLLQSQAHEHRVSVGALSSTRMGHEFENNNTQESNHTAQSALTMNVLGATQDGTTWISPQVNNHPLEPQVRTHEAVHRAQFYARSNGVPVGTRVELESDANTGAKALLAGSPYAPRFAAPAGMLLTYEPPHEPLAKLDLGEAIVAIDELATTAISDNNVPGADAAQTVDSLFETLREVDRSDPLVLPELMRHIERVFPTSYMSALFRRLAREPLDPVPAYQRTPHPYENPRGPLGGRTTPGLIIQPGARALGLSVKQAWEQGYEGTKRQAVMALIEVMNGTHKALVDRLKTQVQNLPALARPIGEAAVTAFDDAGHSLIHLVMYDLGVAVGFGEGLVSIVWGLIKLLIGLGKGLLLLLFALIDGGTAFEEWRVGVVEAILGIPGALISVALDWLERFKEASTEERSFMVGELVGELLAVLVAWEVAAGATPTAMATVPTSLPKLAWMTTPTQDLIPVLVPATTTAVEVIPSTVTSAGVITAGTLGGPQLEPYLISEAQGWDNVESWSTPSQPSPAHSLLPTYLDGGRTYGLLDGVESRLIRLSSGTQGPGSWLKTLHELGRFPLLERVRRNALIALTHAEGHAATILRRTGVMDATLFINRPGGPCHFCVEGTSALLWPQQRLRVMFPSVGGGVSEGHFVGGIEGFAFQQQGRIHGGI